MRAKENEGKLQIFPYVKKMLGNLFLVGLPPGNAKGYTAGWKDIVMPDGNLNTHKEMKSIRNGKYVCKYDFKIDFNISSLNFFKKDLRLSLLFMHSVVSNSLWPHGLQHTSLPCPSPSPGVCSNSCPLTWWCHPTISSSVDPFFSCPQSFPASGSFQVSQFFTSDGQSIRASASHQSFQWIFRTDFL